MNSGPVQQSTFAVAVGGGLVTVLVWALNTYALSIPIPDSMLGVLFTIVVALLSHFVPDSQPVASGTIVKAP